MFSNDIMMIGPDVMARGGISSVVHGYSVNGIMEELGVEYFSTYKGGSHVTKVLFYLSSVIKILFDIHKFKIIHAHSASRWSFRRISPILLISKILNKKAVIHIHGGGFYKYYKTAPSLEKLYIRMLFNYVDKVIVLSEKIKEKIKEFCDFQKIVILNNSVSIKMDSLRISQSKLSIPHKLLFLGTIIDRKGIYDLLKVFKKLLDNGYNCSLTICGEGQIDKVRNELKNLRIDDKTELTGWVYGQKKQNILEEAFLFILPSYVEAFPMSIIEAMSKGIPVVATSVGAINEIIDHGFDGFVIPPGDVDQLYKSIELLIKDKSLWQKMSITAYQKVKSKYNLKNTSTQLKTLYRSIS